MWEPIISEQTRARILSRMAEQKTSGRRSPRRYLLSGLLRCHRCQHTLYSAAREDVRRYVCNSGPDHGGCGGTYVVAASVEDLIAQAVLFRLDTPALADALAGRAANDARTAHLAHALTDDQEQLAELTALYAAKSITAREWMDARNPIQARISKTEQSLARATRSDALAGLVGSGEQLRGSWAGLNLTRQAAIGSAVLDHAVIGPGTPGAQSLDPGRVQPVWRL